MRRDAEEDETGEEGGKVGSQEASRHARNLDSTQDTRRLEKIGSGSLNSVPSLEDLGIFEITPIRPPSIKERQKDPNLGRLH